MPDVHARFSPSSAERLIHCPPSLILGEEYGPADTSSDYTREGTEAHALGEYLLKEALGQPMEDPRPDFKYYTDEMQSCAEGYRDEVLAVYEQLRLEDPSALISIEQRVDFSEYVEEGFGTSDAIVLGAGHLYVIDYKHGKGVPVSAEGAEGDGNPQLKCYGLGAYLAFGPLYEIETITLQVYQPRINNFSQYALTPEALLTWAEDVLRPAGEMALHGEGDYTCGSWCRFCRGKAVCRKRAEENLKLARYDFARPDALEDDEINVILAKVDQLSAWASDLKAYALQRALSGYAWDDWKVVEGRSNRRYKDDEAVAHVVTDAGYDPYTKRLKTVTEMQSLLGKKRFEELLSPLIIKPAGKPALVPRTDPRLEMNSPQADF